MSGPAQRITTTLLVALQTIGYVTASMPSAALAQQAKAGDPPALPRYRVEVLIFRYLDQSRTTEEIQAQPDSVLPPDFDVNGLGGTPDKATQRDTAGSAAATPLVTDHVAASVEFLLLDPFPTPPNFVQLVATQFKLTEVWDKLNQVEAYGPVLHIAWLQPARRAAEAVPYDLVITPVDPDVITGTLTLYKERFLHLEVDLTMREANDVEADSTSGFSSRFELFPDNDDAVYRMNQSRRIRTSNLQYFDHPRFGVIAAVTEYSPLKELDAARGEQGRSEALQETDK